MIFAVRSDFSSFLQHLHPPPTPPTPPTPPRPPGPFQLELWGNWHPWTLHRTGIRAGNHQSQSVPEPVAMQELPLITPTNIPERLLNEVGLISGRPPPGRARPSNTNSSTCQGGQTKSTPKGSPQRVYSPAHLLQKASHNVRVKQHLNVLPWHAESPQLAPQASQIVLCARCVFPSKNY